MRWELGFLSSGIIEFLSCGFGLCRSHLATLASGYVWGV